MKRSLILTIFSLGLCTCERADIREIENLNGGRIFILGHAGLGFWDYSKPYPDNSEISIERAIEGFAADGVEVDVQLSSDSVIFLFHNDLLESASDCQGCVPDHSSAHLQNCRYRENFSANLLKDEKLYTLESMLARYGRYQDLYFFLDVKNYPHCLSGPDHSYYLEALFKEIARLTLKYEVIERVFVEVPSVHEIKRLRGIEAGIRVFAGTSNPSAELLGIAAAGADGIVVRNERISREDVKKAHDLGLMVTLYGVETRNSNIEAVEKYPDIILSDNIRMTREIILDK